MILASDTAFENPKFIREFYMICPLKHCLRFYMIYYLSRLALLNVILIYSLYNPLIKFAKIIHKNKFNINENKNL